MAAVWFHPRNRRSKHLAIPFAFLVIKSSFLLQVTPAGRLMAPTAVTGSGGLAAPPASTACPGLLAPRVRTATASRRSASWPWGYRSLARSPAWRGPMRCEGRSSRRRPEGTRTHRPGRYVGVTPNPIRLFHLETVKLKVYFERINPCYDETNRLLPLQTPTFLCSCKCVDMQMSFHLLDKSWSASCVTDYLFYRVLTSSSCTKEE